MNFKWNGKWEDGKDHSGERGKEQLWLRICINCGNRRGLHTGKSENVIGYLADKDAICPRSIL